MVPLKHYRTGTASLLFRTVDGNSVLSLSLNLIRNAMLQTASVPLRTRSHVNSHTNLRVNYDDLSKTVAAKFFLISF